MASQIAARVSETFSFVKKIPMLQKYTSDDENPTPGYIYQEINSITYETISSCNSLLDFLINRLKKQSPCIKYKVLKILCYLASNGHSEFRSGLRHKADAIREAENFTGQMDYLKGDALNQRVRATASELIGLLFNVETSGKSAIHAMTGPTGKKMEGFGNSLSQPAKNKTWMDSMMTLAERLPDAANILKPKNSPEHLPASGGSGIAFVNCTNPADSPSGLADFKTFLDADDSSHLPKEESENMLSVEARLVDDITCEGGVRNVPSKDALNLFTKRCASLNIAKVFEALNQRLREPITEVQLKSLHVLEHLLKSDIPDVPSGMSRCCRNLREIATTESGSLAARADKVLSIIKAKVEKEKRQQDAKKIAKDFSSEKSKVDNGEDLLNLENLGSSGGFCSQQVDDSTTLFSGMSLHTEQSSTSLKQLESPVIAQGVQHPSDGQGIFQGRFLASGNCLPESDNSSRKPGQSSKSDLDELFGMTQATAEVSSVGRKEELVKDQITDLFDPLCNKDANSESFISPRTNPANVNAPRPVFSGFTGSIHGQMNSLSGSHTFIDLDGLSRNTHVQPRVALPGNVLPRTSPNISNFPNTSHPTVRPPFLSGGSTIPLRLPPPIQGNDFSFVGKSKGADAFSFVQDEMKARK